MKERLPFKILHEDKDVIVIDDMIASGDSIIDVSKQLKAKGARRVFLFAPFGLFTAGPEVFDRAYEEGIFTPEKIQFLGILPYILYNIL